MTVSDDMNRNCPHGGVARDCWICLRESLEASRTEAATLRSALEEISWLGPRVVQQAPGMAARALHAEPASTTSPLPVARLEQAEALALKNALAVVVTVANWDTFGQHGNLVQAARRAEDGLRAFLAGQAVPVEVDPVEAILAVECPDCGMEKWPCFAVGDSKMVHLDRIRASRTTTRAR